MNKYRMDVEEERSEYHRNVYVRWFSETFFWFVSTIVIYLLNFSIYIALSFASLAMLSNLYWCFKSMVGVQHKGEKVEQFKKRIEGQVERIEGFFFLQDLFGNIGDSE